MADKSSPPLIIISDNQAHIMALREACAGQFDVVRVYADFSQMQLGDGDKDRDKNKEKDSFILAVISGRQYDDAMQCALDHTVFALINDKVEDNAAFDASVFESVFQYPTRLGQLVEAMKDVAEQKALHKRMASIKLGKITLDPKTSSLSGDDNMARLTEKEAAILIFLSEQNGVAVSRQNLLDEVWGYAKDVETHTLETHIYRLRQKIKTQLGLDDFLVTNDEGYILNF